MNFFFCCNDFLLFLSLFVIVITGCSAIVTIIAITKKDYSIGGLYELHCYL